MLTTNYNQYAPTAMPAQYFGAQKAASEGADFASMLAQQTQGEASDDAIYQSFLAKSGDEIVAHFGLTMHKAGLDDVADSMIATAKNDGTIDMLRFGLLRQQFLQHLESVQQQTGIELDDEDFQQMLASIPSQGLFHGLGKNGILEQLTQLFENPPQSDDAARQLQNQRFSQSMLDAIRKGMVL